MTQTILLILVLLFCTNDSQSAKDAPPANPPFKPILRGHAHNDYLHPRPCLDALDNGFCSIEADIFYVKEMLLVGHFSFQLKPERSLENLYLKPLRQRAQQHGGKIIAGAETFYLWIELKTDARSTYEALKKMLEKYADILTRYENNTMIPGAVTVILTGKANLGLIRNEPVRYAGVDGVRSALESNTPSHLVPTVSLNWREEFPLFKEKLSFAEQEKLSEQVQKAHSRGRKLRYWNAPDNEVLWQIFLDAGVDFINTNRLEPLRKYLLQ